MNHRFKFRVWDKIKKRFYNGTNLNLNDYEEVYSDPAGIFFTGLHFLQKDENQYIIQQYTGLNDKNGKEVYEGDIIRGMFDFGPAGFKEEIIPINWDNESGYQLEYCAITTIEVIGNIFENPELLK